MTTYVRTVAPVVCRHIVDGVPEPADVPIGTLCLLIGDEEAAGSFMLVVDDPGLDFHGDECWNVPADLFVEVTPT